METRDKELIERLLKEDDEFRKLHVQHIAYEQEIEELLAKKPKTTELHFQIEGLKKKKLMGKDKMERILTKHR